jgi:hypothetical protein
MIVFLHIPKTAGTSFHFILENNFGLSYCHTNHTKKHQFTVADANFARKVFPRLRAVAGHNLIDPLSLPFPDPFHMTFLREPVARVLSQYQERSIIYRQLRRPVLDFEEALRVHPEFENLHVKLMAGECNLAKAKRYLERCHFVGLTEEFDLSLRVLKKLCPYELEVNYQKRRVQTDNSIRERLEADPHAMALVREANKLDIELYAFAVREVFPKLCAKAGFGANDRVAPLNTYGHNKKFNIILSQFYNRLIYRQLCKLRR